MELCLSVGLLACVSCRPGCSWSSAYLLVCWHVCPVDQDVSWNSVYWLVCRHVCPVDQDVSWNSVYLLVSRHVCPVDHDVHGSLLICWFVGMSVL